jgi:hypothetical protein
MRRLFHWAFNGAAVLSARIRPSIDAFYAFDDRLYDRMDTSTAFTKACLTVAWLLLLVQCCIFWWMGRGSNLIIQKVAGIFVLLSGGLWLIGRYRLRQQSLTHRIKAGLCPTCGYDLRASPGRCPECGAMPRAKGALD